MRIALLAALLLLAGCLSPAPAQPATPPAVAAFVNPIALDHDHLDAANHTLANAMRLVGHTYLTPQGPPGGLGEIDVAGHYAYVATFGHGFSIIDLADPAQPKLVSVTDVPTPASPIYGKYTADLKVDRTGDWVFLAMEVSATPGVLIYDAHDKAAPKLAGFWPEPGLLLGCHMVEYAVINEQEYLFCAPLDNAIYVGLLLPPTATGHREVVQVARFVPTSAKFAQEQAASATADPVGYPLSQVSGHQDMTYQLDPLTGKPTLFVSFWNLGMRIVDVSTPALPSEVGAWSGEQSKYFRGALHTTVAFRQGDRRIIATIPEGATPPTLFILDATDLANPVPVAEWRALEDFHGEDGTFSMHNFQVVGGRIYIAMYHAGIWVIDVSTPDLLKAPNPVGSYLPHMPRPDGKPYGAGDWDVVVWSGYVLTADGNGGFYVLHHDGDPAGDEKFTSFA
ncbi:MAG TPA: hypothetical protein VM241_08670 [Candidatus Thermoplasmatota archaeon]|nr:hypothetical protein [Candidatus Thermoplasmatota archaeon]